MDAFEKYPTARQVPKTLEITEECVRDLIKPKKVKAVKISKWRIYPERLERYKSKE